MLAIEAGCPIIPVLIRGTFEAYPPGRVWPKRTPLSVFFGKALDPGAAENKTSGPLHKQAKQLNQELNNRILALWNSF